MFEEVEAPWVLVVGGLQYFPDTPDSKGEEADPAKSQGDYVAVH